MNMVMLFLIGASATHLRKLDSVQKLAEKLCGTTFSSLAFCRNASSIGLLCKVQDLLCQDPLQSFCPAFTKALASMQYPYSFRHVEDDDFLFQQLTQYNSLDIFINNFLGQIPSIWASIPLTLRQRTFDEQWTNLLTAERC